MKCYVCGRTLKLNGLHDISKVKVGEVTKVIQRGGKAVRATISKKAFVHASCKPAFQVTKRIMEAVS